MKVNGRKILVEMVKKKYPFLNRCATSIVDDIFSELHTTIDELKPEDSVTILKFGRFKKTRRGGRYTKNPANGEKLFVPEHDIIRFKYNKAEEKNEDVR